MVIGGLLAFASGVLRKARCMDDEANICSIFGRRLSLPRQLPPQL